MADKFTPEQVVAEMAATALEGQRYRLLERKKELLRAAEEIAEIDAILAAMEPETTRLEPKRPPKPAVGIDFPGGTVRTPKE